MLPARRILLGERRTRRTHPMADEPGQESPSGHEIPIRAFATVWFTLFLDLLGFGLILPLLPYYALNFGASPTTVALLSTTFSAAQFVMSPILGRISDRFGRRKVMLISIGGSCAAMLTLGFASTLWMVFAARLISGMGNANMSTAHAYVADRVEPKLRARYMGIMGSAIGLGFIIGPALGGLLSHPEFRELPFLVAAGLAAVNWIMAFVWLPESRPPEARKASSRPLFVFRPAILRQVAGTQLGWILVLNFLFYFAFASMESTYALFAEARFDWGERETGLMFTGIGVVFAVVQGLVIGRLVARIGEKRTLLFGYAMVALGLSLSGMAWVVLALIVGSLCTALGNGLISPNINALVSRSSSMADQGLSLGLASSAAALARIVGPTVAGPVFEGVGEGIPMVMGACSIVLAIGVASVFLGAPEDPV